MIPPDRYLTDVLDALAAASGADAAACIAVQAAHELGSVDGLCLLARTQEHSLVALAQGSQIFRCDLRASGMYRAAVRCGPAGTRTLWGKEDAIELPTGEHHPVGLALIVPLQSASGHLAVTFVWQPGRAANHQQMHRLELLAKALGLAACAWRKDAEHELLQRAQAHATNEDRHRPRNNIALMRSVIRRSIQTAESADHFALHLEARIGALSRTQALLAAAGHAGVELEELVRTELIANAAPEQRCLVQGPRVRLLAKAAESLGLAMHELATNSLKFGALAAASGSVTIRWRVRSARTAPRLHLSWIEHGVTVMSVAPRRRGFGQEIIECTLPYELGAQSRLRFNPGGVHCEIDVPLAACVASIEPQGEQAALERRQAP